MSLDGKETVRPGSRLGTEQGPNRRAGRAIGLEAQMQLINSRKYDSMPA